MIPPEVDRLIRWLPDWFGEVSPGKGRCIEAARIMVAALRRAGVDCKAIAADVVAFNAQAWDLWTAEVPITDWPITAWTVGCQCDQPAKRTTRNGERHSFDGHVVVVGADWLADATAIQFHRPAKGIHMSGAIAVDFPAGANVIPLGRESGTRLVYRLRPEIAAWRLTPAWRQDLERDILDRLALVCSGADA